MSVFADAFVCASIPMKTQPMKNDDDGGDDDDDDDGVDGHVE